MSGRTTWWAKDAAWHRRELQVELGEEFGAAGPMVIDILSAWSQEQRVVGSLVVGGFRTLGREAFVTASHAEAIVRRAAAIGALDELQVDADGRRFTCRVSGLKADQERGRAAFRQAAKRERDAETPDEDRDSGPEASPQAPAELDVTDQDVVTASHGPSRNITPSALPDQTNTERTSSSVEPSLDALDDPDVVRLCDLLADLIVQRDPKAKARVTPDGKRWRTAMRLLIADREGDVDEVERVLRWSQADEFWQANILSPGKLREKFTELRLKSRSGGQLRAVDPQRDERRARRGGALDKLLAPTQPPAA